MWLSSHALVLKAIIDKEETRGGIERITSIEAKGVKGRKLPTDFNAFPWTMESGLIKERSPTVMLSHHMGQPHERMGRRILR